jgi:hypothetical protein
MSYICIIYAIYMLHNFQDMLLHYLLHNDFSLA